MFKLGLLMLAAYAYTSSAHNPPRCLCPVEYNPVCGTNGKNYISQCVLRCAQRQGVAVKLQKRGHCGEPACACGPGTAPVCGSDGVTYGNDCLLNCATKDDHTLSVAHAGSCQHTVVVVHQPECVCSDDFRPVCGADGVTYPSECALKCANQNLARRGPCEPACKCPKDGKKICASDGNTYDNTCQLHCAIKHDSSLHALYGGPCKHDSSCSCKNLESFPVCGSDMKTYDNECVMVCAGAKLVKAGPCEPPCACPAGGPQVCGSDGVTYANDCELNCATKDDSRLSVAKAGPCDAGGGGVVNFVDQSHCGCTRDLQTVCGTDGVTYNNMCLLRCAGHQLKQDGPCPPPCVCPKGGKAVCGSDGKTYDNVCRLNCVTQYDHTLKVAHPGNCISISDLARSSKGSK